MAVAGRDGAAGSPAEAAEAGGSGRSAQGGDLVSQQVPADCFNFAVGQPGPALLARAEAALAAAAAAHSAGSPAEERRAVLQYAPRAGAGRFRESLAKFLQSHPDYGGGVAAADLVATSGNSHGLALCCGTLADPARDLVLVEQPTYFLAEGVFRTAGLQTAGAPMRDGLLDLERLPAFAEQLERDTGKRVGFLYVVPTHSNPLGRTLPAEMRRQLVRLAEERGWTILSDDVYQLLTFPAGTPPPEPLASFSASVVSLGSFSKIFAPGLRLGWIHCRDEATVAKLKGCGTLTSGGSTNPYVANLVHRVMASGAMADLLSTVRGMLEERAAALYAAVEEHLPEVRFHRPEGGYFVWLDLAAVNPRLDTEHLLVQAARWRLGFTPGRLCGGAATALRVSFAFYDPGEYGEGIALLAEAVREYREGTGPAGEAGRAAALDVVGD